MLLVKHLAMKLGREILIRKLKAIFLATFCTFVNELLSKLHQMQQTKKRHSTIVTFESKASIRVIFVD